MLHRIKKDDGEENPDKQDQHVQSCRMAFSKISWRAKYEDFTLLSSSLAKKKKKLLKKKAPAVVSYPEAQKTMHKGITTYVFIV